MKRILLTGANGFVGQNLLQPLLDKGFTVLATGRSGPTFSKPHAALSYAQLDFTNAEDVEKIFENFHPDVVIHSGALSAPDFCEQNKEAAYQANVEGTRILLHEAARQKAYFLFLSTSFVFEGNSTNYVESDALRPVNYYGETKKSAETLVQQYPFAWSIIRTVLVYGKALEGRHNFVTGIAAKIARGEKLRIFSDQLRTPCYIKDLVWAIVKITEVEAEGIYHISGKDLLSPYDMAVAAAKHLKLDENLIENITEKDLKEPAKRPPVTGLNISKAAKDLEYQPTSFADALKEIFG